MSEMTHCAIGALRKAGMNGSQQGHVEEAILNYLYAETGKNWESVPGWNDNRNTTEEEVRETLLIVAKRLRNDE